MIDRTMGTRLPFTHVRTSRLLRWRISILKWPEAEIMPETNGYNSLSVTCGGSNMLLAGVTESEVIPKRQK